MSTATHDQAMQAGAALTGPPNLRGGRMPKEKSAKRGGKGGRVNRDEIAREKADEKQRTKNLRKARQSASADNHGEHVDAVREKESEMNTGDPVVLPVDNDREHVNAVREEKSEMNTGNTRVLNVERSVAVVKSDINTILEECISGFVPKDELLRAEEILALHQEAHNALAAHIADDIYPKMDALEETIARLEMENASVKNTSEIEALVKEVERLNTEDDRVRKHIEQLDVKVFKLEAKVLELEAKVTQLEAKVVQLEAEKAAAERTVVDLNQDFKARLRSAVEAASKKAVGRGNGIEEEKMKIAEMYKTKGIRFVYSGGTHNLDFEGVSGEELQVGLQTSGNGTSSSHLQVTARSVPI